jgi:hypothetical protein
MELTLLPHPTPANKIEKRRRMRGHDRNSHAAGAFRPARVFQTVA